MVQLPEGVELSLSELEEMATRQQQQIDNQQQLLVAREQRLRYLRSQDASNHQNIVNGGLANNANLGTDRLRQLREKVEHQEMKLRRLRALRTQVDQQKVHNTSLSSELDSVRALFSEKEKQLTVAVAKVEELTRQLEDLRRNGGTKQLNNSDIRNNYVSTSELDKLRQELAYRNQLMEQQKHKLGIQEETLTVRKDEVTRIDRRIAELQQRLRRRRMLNVQLATQINNAKQLKNADQQRHQVMGSRPLSGCNVAAVEPFNKHELQLNNKENSCKLNYDDDCMDEDDILSFQASKSDPKYQTLPYNTKFSGGGIPPYNNKSGFDMRDHERPSVIDKCGDVQPLSLDGRINTYQESHQFQHSPSKQNAVTVIQSMIPQPKMAVSQPVAITKVISPPPSVPPPPPPPLPPPISVKSIVDGISAKENQNSISSQTNSPIRPSHIPRPSAIAYQYSPTKLLSSSKLSAIAPLPGSPSGTAPIRITSTHSTNVAKVVPAVAAKPALPPKTVVVPLKPMPPPRQSGSPADSPVRTEGGTAKGINIRHKHTNRIQNSFPKPSQGPVSLEQYFRGQLIGEDSQQGEDDEDGTSPEANQSQQKQEMNTKARPLTIKRFEDGTIKLKVSPNSGSSPKSSPVRYDDHSSKTTIEIQDNQTYVVRQTTDNENFGGHGRPATVCVIVGKPQVQDGDHTQSRLDEEDDGQNYFEEYDIETADVQDKEFVVSTIDSHNNVESKVVYRSQKGGLKTNLTVNAPNQGRILTRRVSFDPLALLLDASLEGELELVKKTATEVYNPSAANDEGITALHNAICAGHTEIVHFLVDFGCDVNAQDSDGWTPLHCAASCNNLSVVKFLIERGACIFATTISDHETAADKCEEDEDGYDTCSEYLYSIQEKLGILNGGVVFSLYDYTAQNPDELTFGDGAAMTVLRKGDDSERDWWWARLNDKEGYVPKNLLGLYPRVESSNNNKKEEDD